jgi:hypothetical protein
MVRPGAATREEPTWLRLLDATCRGGDRRGDGQYRSVGQAEFVGEFQGLLDVPPSRDELTGRVLVRVALLARPI